MKKAPLVFSFVREQKTFMSALIGLLSFLGVLALGISIAIGTAVVRWNQHWDLYATVQIMPKGDAKLAEKIIDSNMQKFESAKKISQDEIDKMLRPWLSGGRALENYIPQMYEIKFKSKNDMADISALIEPIPGARFLSHSAGMKSSTGAGIRIILISGFVLLLILGAIGICVSYITRNITMIHKRELGILNQIGAGDGFIIRQLMIVIARITAGASMVGFLIAAPILLLITQMAHGTKVGLMSQMAITGIGWVALILMPLIITVASIIIVKNTTLQILDNK